VYVGVTSSLHATCIQFRYPAIFSSCLLQSSHVRFNHIFGLLDVGQVVPQKVSHSTINGRLQQQAKKIWAHAEKVLQQRFGTAVCKRQQ
jgi:hypothetical protein